MLHSEFKASLNYMRLYLKKQKAKAGHGGVVVSLFNPNTWISEFEASLIYIGRSRTARALQGNPVSNEQQTKQSKTEELERD